MSKETTRCVKTTTWSSLLGVAGRDPRTTGQLKTRLGYSADASRSEQVRWLVSRCEPLVLVFLSAHYLLRTSVWPVSIPLLIAAVAGFALGLFGAVYPTNSRLGMLRATAATLLLIAISMALSNHLVDFVPWYSDPRHHLSAGVRPSPRVPVPGDQRDRGRLGRDIGVRRHIGPSACPCGRDRWSSGWSGRRRSRTGNDLRIERDPRRDQGPHQ